MGHSRPNIDANAKDQDVAIYKKYELTKESGEVLAINVPVVCIECKTYLDKTMLAGSIATARDIKACNPSCLFIIVTEWYAVATGVSVDPAVDNVFVLRKSRHQSSNRNAWKDNPIYASVVDDVVSAITTHITNLGEMPVDQMIKSKGRIR